MKKSKMQISGLNSVQDAARVARILSALPSAKDVRVSLELATMEHDNIADEALLRAIEAAGNFKGQIIHDEKAATKPVSNLLKVIGSATSSAGLKRERPPMPSASANPAKAFFTY